MQQYVCRSRRHRRRVSADDAIEGEGTFHDVALEPLVEVVGGTLRKEIDQQSLIVERQAKQAAAEASVADQFEQSAASIWGRAQNEIAQYCRCSLQSIVVGRQPIGIALGKRRDRCLPLGKSVRHEQRAAGIHRPEIRHRAFGDAQAMAAKIEVADHLRVEQTDRVRCDRVAEPRRKLLRDCRAAGRGVLLDHDHAQARAGQIRRAHQSVVAAADDRNVVGFNRHRAFLNRFGLHCNNEGRLSVVAIGHPVIAFGPKSNHPGVFPRCRSQPCCRPAP